MKWLLDLLRTRRMRRDIGEELHSHIEEKIDSLVAAGMPEAEARRAAHREFGNIALFSEDARFVWGSIWLERLVQDVRLGIHQMLKRPGFTAAAVFSMALGIGVNAVAFSVLHGVLLRPLPFPEAERLVRISTVPPRRPGDRAPAAVPDFVAWRDQNRVFDLIAAVNDVDRDLGADANGRAAQKIYGQMVTASVFELTGMHPVLGRTFTAAEDRMDNAAPVVVLSHRLWLARYSGDPGILGRKIRMDGEPLTVIGIAPRGYSVFNEKADFWAPIPFHRTQLQGASRYIVALARLKPGVTREQAQSQMDSVANGLAASLPGHAKGWGVHIDPAREAELAGFREPLLIFQLAAALVLAIACANVAGLLLARSASRGVEVAVRAALGAGRWRIVRQFLTESLLLGVAGGACGLLLAWWGLRLLVTVSPAWLPGLHDIVIDRTVLSFTAALSILTGVAFGALPSLQASRCDLATALRAAPRASGAGFAGQRPRSVLVVSQIALSVVLLTAAALMIHTFARLRAVRPGFDAQGLVTFRFRLPHEPYQRATGKAWNGFPLQEISPVTEAMFNRVADRLRGVPGVLAATAVSDPPFAEGLPVDFTIEDRPIPAPGGEDRMNADAFFVERTYFQTLRIPMARGRAFSERDTAAAPWSVIVNEAMAERYWPHENPIGRGLTVALGKEDQIRRIIGVARNTRESHFESAPYPCLYIVDTQQPTLIRGPYSPHRRLMTFVLRTAGTGGGVLNAVRAAVSSIAPEQAIGEMRTVDDLAGEELQWNRFYAILLGMFAGIAALLAGVGIYGVIAYSVQQRTREFGIRLALGASRGKIVAMVLRQAVLMLSIGALCGIAGALGLARFIASQLWGVSPTDPVTYGAVAGLLCAVGLAASWLPARRALRVNPNAALRYE